jgi:predicted dehydrogenase
VFPTGEELKPSDPLSNPHVPSTFTRSLQQGWLRTARPRPIVIIGARGIVRDAHLPAYRLENFRVAGVYDRDPSRAEAFGRRWGVPVMPNLASVVDVKNAVFDLAIPPQSHVEVLSALPRGSIVLLQKPMGRDLGEATRILEMVEDLHLTAAVNFQLRFAPMMLAVDDAPRRGILGKLADIEIHLHLLTRWDQFPYPRGLPPVEIAVHSIHYLDLIRHLVGEPASVMARTLKHPLSALAQTRTSAILDCNEPRCTLSINHDHAYGCRFQDATFRLEGTEGAAAVKLGLLLGSPRGEPDELWIARRENGEWEQIPLEGSWFPHAFIGIMSNLQRCANREDDHLITPARDAWHTMVLVEACFRSSAEPGTPVPRSPEQSEEREYDRFEALQCPWIAGWNFFRSPLDNAFRSRCIAGVERGDLVLRGLACRTEDPFATSHHLGRG